MWSTLVVLALFGVSLTMSVLYDLPPKEGECLADLDKNLIGGWDVVECGDPDAAYEVAVVRLGGVEDICRDHPTGLAVRDEGIKGKAGRNKGWGLCLVPVTR